MRPGIKASETRWSRLFILGVDGLEATLASHLSRGRTVRFSDTLEDRFFEELAPERRLVRCKRAMPDVAGLGTVVVIPASWQASISGLLK